MLCVHRDGCRKQLPGHRLVGRHTESGGGLLGERTMVTRSLRDGILWGTSGTESQWITLHAQHWMYGRSKMQNTRPNAAPQNRRYFLKYFQVKIYIDWDLLQYNLGAEGKINGTRVKQVGTRVDHYWSEYWKHNDLWSYSLLWYKFGIFLLKKKAISFQTKLY